VYNILAFITLLLSCYFLLHHLEPADPPERILTFFCLFTAHIVILGYILSFMNCLSDIRYWAILGIITVIISAVVTWNRKNGPSVALSRFKFALSTDAIRSIKSWYSKELSSFEKLLLTPLILTTLLTGILNLIVIVFSAPHNWDSMTYHLARVAYYLQHNNLTSFNTNYWAQVVHPQNSSLLLLYTYLISGHNENLTQLVQFVSYWIAVCSVYAISTKVGNSKTQSVFAAMVSALLIEWLMQATTTQNDLILTAYLGATVYFLLMFRETQKLSYLIWAASAIGLSIGTKAASLLYLPAVALVASYALIQSGVGSRDHLRKLAVLVASTLLAICIFALPAGYIENYRQFGHPLGPKRVRADLSFEGSSASYIIRNGTKNLIRFGFDFLSPDGMPSASIVRKLPEKIVRRLGIDLETSEATRRPFNIQKTPTAHEDLSSWGVFGFGLIWVVIILSLMGVVKPTDVRILSLAAVLFLFCQAYCGPYDPWRGRYFTQAAIFAVPTVGLCLKTKNRLIRAYLLLIVLAGCISAVSAVVLRNNSALISTCSPDKCTTSIFAMDRMEQLTRNRTEYYEPLKRFDQLVPKDARVAAFLPRDTFVYPLFGEYLTRTIMPINSFYKGLLPIPACAEYLLYAKEFPCASAEDIYLGADWRLRRLTDDNRRCP
jgi:hypothetical protein